jgi:hypothetical protein
MVNVLWGVDLERIMFDGNLVVGFGSGTDLLDGNCVVLCGSGTEFGGW